ncbi:MAG: hypothetical protein FWD69_00675 [Polyangiaceae bacterium]|nr:hypothetical protein [Polyangiaceae bacterium]
MRICAIHLPELRVEVRPEDVCGELARLAEIALAFGATVAFEQASSARAKRARDDLVGCFGDVVWVDITGCAHLHGPNQEQGEQVLVARLASAMVDQGHACAVVCADGPRVSAILARARFRFDAISSLGPAVRSSKPIQGCSGPLLGPASTSRQLESGRELQRAVCATRVVSPGKNAAAMAELEISALPLPESDVRWLTKLGVRSVMDLTSLPRASLASRLGALAPVVLALAHGDDRAPLTPYLPPSIPEEEVSLEYGVTGTEALVFVTKTLTDRLASRLAARAVATSRLELVLSLDRALLEDASKHEEIIVFDLPSPLSRAQDLLSALRPRIERLALCAPVLSAKLRAPLLVHKPQTMLSLFDPLPKADTVLPRLVAELAADLGDLAVGKLALGDAWQPEDRSRFVRIGEPPAPPRKRLLSSIPEPTRIVEEPIVVPRERVRIVRRLARLESVDWWKRAQRTCDYVEAWIEEAHAWVEIDCASGLSRVRGWFD